MAVYVFLTSKFMPAADANGICVYNISKELVKNGHKVCVICEGINEEHYFFEEIEIREVKPTLFSKLRHKAAATKSKKYVFIKNIVMVLRRIQKAFILFIYPNVSPLRARQEYKILEEIARIEKIDFLVSTFAPYEGVTAACKFKKKYPGVKSSIIFWDILRSKNPFGKHLYKLFDFLCNRAEKKAFSINDKILIPKSGEGIYSAGKYDKYKEKIKYFDFPVFTEGFDNQANNINEFNDYINITCIGTIDGENRNADYFLKIFNEIKRRFNISVKINIIGAFSDISTYEKYKTEPYVNFMGQVNFNDIPNYISSADYLVNLGNKITYDMIPSKIFQYFASCKPVINFISHKDDKSLCYFKKYPSNLNIFEYENNISEDICRVKDFILNNDMVLSEFAEIEKIYKENKPSYFTEEFLK